HRTPDRRERRGFKSKSKQSPSSPRAGGCEAGEEGRGGEGPRRHGHRFDDWERWDRRYGGGKNPFFATGTHSLSEMVAVTFSIGSPTSTGFWCFNWKTRSSGAPLIL